MRSIFIICLITFVFSYLNLYSHTTNEDNMTNSVVNDKKRLKNELQHLDYNNIDSAISKLEKLITYDKNNSYDVYLGYLYFVKGKYDKSKEIMESVLKRDPKSVVAYLVLGEIFYQQNNIIESRDIYEQLNKISPDLKTVHIRLYELLKNNNEAEANKHYLKIFQLPTTKIEKYLPEIEDIGKINITSPDKIVIMKGLGIDNKIKVKEGFIENILSETGHNSQYSNKSVILTVKKHRGLKINFNTLSSPFKKIDSEKFYSKLIEVLIVSLVFIIYSIATKRQRERLKKYVVSNYRINPVINKF